MPTHGNSEALKREKFKSISSTKKYFGIISCHFFCVSLSTFLFTKLKSLLYLLFYSLFFPLNISGTFFHIYNYSSVIYICTNCIMAHHICHQNILNESLKVPWPLQKDSLVLEENTSFVTLYNLTSLALVFSYVKWRS